MAQVAIRNLKPIPKSRLVECLKEGDGAETGGILTVGSKVTSARVEVSISDSGPDLSVDVLPRIIAPL